MTNIYLSQAEFELLEQVEGAALTKTRWHWTVGDSVFSVDQFGERLQGLVIAEIELRADGLVPAIPPLTVLDVTEDDRFSGGRVASLTSLEAANLLKEVATMTDTPRSE
jgi:CYTH domain-containing protein